jgi:hypothetical protein
MWMDQKEIDRIYHQYVPQNKIQKGVGNKLNGWWEWAKDLSSSRSKACKDETCQNT